MRNQIDVKIKFLDHNREKTMPVYASSGAAGMDLSACIDEEIVLKPMERRAIPTGIAIGLPNENYGAFIFARSGLGLKKGITLPNCVGVIDSDYTGEIMVALINLSDEDFVIKNGDRIAQMVIHEVSHAAFTAVDNLDETKRGSGGFGSTGIGR